MAAVWSWTDRKRCAWRGDLKRPMIFSRRRVGRCDASARCSILYASGVRHPGKDPGRPRRSCAACPSQEPAARPIFSSVSSENALQHGHSCGFALGFPARHRWHRRLAKASVSGRGWRSRPSRGAICRPVPVGRAGFWQQSESRTVGTRPGCFHRGRMPDSAGSYARDF